MEIYRLTINHEGGDSFTYSFADVPEVRLFLEHGVVEYSGERLKVWYIRVGLRSEVERVESWGPGKVWISVRNVVNWFVERNEILVPDGGAPAGEDE